MLPAHGFANYKIFCLPITTLNFPPIYIAPTTKIGFYAILSTFILYYNLHNQLPPHPNYVHHISAFMAASSPLRVAASTISGFIAAPSPLMSGYFNSAFMAIPSPLVSGCIDSPFMAASTSLYQTLTMLLLLPCTPSHPTYFVLINLFTLYFAPLYLSLHVVFHNRH